MLRWSKRDGYQHPRFASLHLFEPRAPWRTAFPRPDLIFVKLLLMSRYRPFCQDVDLMETSRFPANVLRLAMKMFKMQIQEPGIFGMGCEIMRRSRRRPAKMADRAPDFRGQLADMLGIPGGDP
jgi:hypothetical protein